MSHLCWIIVKLFCFFFMQQQQMISIIAKRYYIENGHEIKENLLRQVVHDSFPPYVLTTIAEDDLIKSVKDAFNAVRFFVILSRETFSQ